MTREEIKKAWRVSDNMLSHSGLIRLINYIYDDIESQKCKTCDHYYLDKSIIEEGVHSCKVLSIKYLKPHTFSCSEYKRKTNGKK